MKKVFEEVNWYALGKKSAKHGKKEYKNITAVQDFLGELPPHSIYLEIFESQMERGN